MKNYYFKPGRVNIPVIINTVIFIFLSILHFYWAFGGQVWYDAVLPTTSNGLHKLNPSLTASLIVAFGLLLFAIITAANKGLFDRYIKRGYFRCGTLIISIIFLFGI